MAPMPVNRERLKACHCCGLVQRVGMVPEGHVAHCVRCEMRIHDPRKAQASNRRTRAAAGAALILFPLAISLPIMRIERFGHAHDASVWSGGVGLLSSSQWPIGVLVVACSIVIPLIKLVLLFAVASDRPLLSRRGRARSYRWIEWAGRWGMLDVLLIAIVVAWLKLGDLVEVRPGPATWTFAAMVVLSLVASAWFDPHALWDREPLAQPSNS